MNPKLISIAVFCLLLVANVQAQKKKKDFVANRVSCVTGDVKPEDFAPTVYAVDSSADAVYLFDGGASKFEGNQKGFFDIVYKKHSRIRLLHKAAFDLATIEIPLHVFTNYEEKLKDINAFIYNIEDGKVVTTKLDKSAYITENTITVKQGKIKTIKFTFPNIKEGAIIEYNYTINYPDIDELQPWVFQGKYPRLWSEYEVEVPEIFDYILLKQGYQPYVIDTTKISHDNYNITSTGGDAASRTESMGLSSNTFNSIWAMRNVPGLKEEKYTTTLDNHISKIQFQLSALKYPNQPVKPYMQTWSAVTDTLMHKEYFGEALNHPNNYLNDDVKAAVGSAATNEEKIKAIYEFVRDNYSCISHNTMYVSQPTKKTYQAKKGNVTDINILLAAMLQSAGVEVHPMLLSTRDNGKAYDMYPILDNYNYVLCEAKADNKRYVLDASYPKLGFNHLMLNCYNGYSHVVDGAFPEIISLSADSLREGKLTSVFIVNGAADKLSAAVSSKKGFAESLSIREQLNKASLPDYFKEIKKSFTGEVDITNGAVDSLTALDDPITVRYDLSLDFGDEDIVYFNPMMMEQQKENIFTAAERLYPVEMPYCRDETYVLNMEMPKGYVIDELPKSTRVKLNEDEGMFEYIVAKNGDYIQMRSRVKLEKATYFPDDYQTLRDFFAYIVKKQAEQIVFKKVK